LTLLAMIATDILYSAANVWPVDVGDVSKTYSSKLNTKTSLKTSVISAVHCDVVNIPLGLAVSNKKLYYLTR